jgi:hypothetical protein
MEGLGIEIVILVHFMAWIYNNLLYWTVIWDIFRFGLSYQEKSDNPNVVEGEGAVAQR